MLHSAQLTERTARSNPEQFQPGELLQFRRWLGSVIFVTCWMCSFQPELVLACFHCNAELSLALCCVHPVCSVFSSLIRCNIWTRCITVKFHVHYSYYRNRLPKDPTWSQVFCVFRVDFPPKYLLTSCFWRYGRNSVSHNHLNSNTKVKVSSKVSGEGILRLWLFEFCSLFIVLFTKEYDCGVQLFTGVGLVKGLRTTPFVGPISLGRYHPLRVPFCWEQKHLIIGMMCTQLKLM